MLSDRLDYTASQILPDNHLNQATSQPQFAVMTSGGSGFGVAYFHSHNKNNAGRGDRGRFDWDLVDHLYMQIISGVHWSRNCFGELELGIIFACLRFKVLPLGRHGGMPMSLRFWYLQWR